MKPLWNALLLSLHFVILSNGTVVLAETPVPVLTRETPASSTTETSALPDLVIPAEVVQPSPTPEATEIEKSAGVVEASPSSEAIEAPEPALFPELIEAQKPAQTPQPAPSPEATDTQQPAEVTKPAPTPEATDTQKPAQTPEPAPSPEATDTQQPAEATEPAPSPEATDKKSETPAPPSPEEVARQQKLMEADKLYLGGQFAEAEKLYREAKAAFSETVDTDKRRAAIVDPTQMSPAAKVYWREAEAGFAQKLQTRTLVPLQLLVEQHPEFIPGHIRLAEALKQYDRPKEALDVLERAATLYPDQADLIKVRVAALAEAEKWMEASLAARQFAILYSDRAEAAEFAQLAEENLKRYKSHLRAELRGNAIANVITGALGYALTGSLFGPFSALDSTIMLLRGEESIGESVANQAKKQLELVEDEEVLAYVNEIGHKIAHVGGRSDFKYEFYVIMDDDLNAFALPGGKIFINAGAIVKTNSEAELAGLIAHELSHAVLSHGFQLVTQGNLVANVTQYLPFGGTIGNLFTLNYSREMERQADTLGTRLLTATGYAADGLRNLMVTMEKEEKNSPPFSWLSSHPATDERVSYLEKLISENRYNRYAYEGVARHAAIKERVKKLIAEHKKEKEEEEEEKIDERRRR